MAGHHPQVDKVSKLKTFLFGHKRLDFHFEDLFVLGYQSVDADRKSFIPAAQICVVFSSMHIAALAYLVNFASFG